MQYRMKTHMLDKEEIDKLLNEIQTGCLATINCDGTPYVIPVHFVYLDHAIYIHGLPKGKKIENMKANPSVSMTVYNMDGLLLDAKHNPCDTNTKYQSVIIDGKAVLLEDYKGKANALGKIVEKYTPHLADKTLPENMVRGTAVIKIAVNEITGKYYM
ncbi:MAG: pyridoxamine 5'-phosphate oxidase family protein [Ruminococcus sp.]|nr:pyridoxamine 5'-phosphate oxidase family protein [Ruminococcus sp.]